MNEIIQAVSRKVDRLEGSTLAVESLLLSMCEVLPPETLPVVQAFYASEVEAVRAQLRNMRSSIATMERFEIDARRLAGRLSQVGV
jgi:hypothetical protein